jgi:hypothetical protein
MCARTSQAEVGLAAGPPFHRATDTVSSHPGENMSGTGGMEAKWALDVGVKAAAVPVVVLVAARVSAAARDGMEGWLEGGSDGRMGGWVDGREGEGKGKGMLNGAAFSSLGYRETAQGGLRMESEE